LSIALDAMGGDHAPKEIVHGAVEAAAVIPRDIILVGDPDEIQQHLPKPCPTNIQVHPASQVIEMHEKPIEAWRRKRDSSMVVAAELVKSGRAGAFVSAGNTGAATAISLLSWRAIEGIHRPAIASEMPSSHGSFLLLDAGASPDVDPEHLVEFALMGRAYAQKVLGRPDPRVRLLNIGEEEGKGNAFTKIAFGRLAEHHWFDGNIEGKDLFRTKVDIVVCDAFVGNVVLKTSEGVAEFILTLIRERLPKGTLARLPYWPLKKLLNPLRKNLDYAETGGSPLLGLNGLCVICHGRSNAKAIKNALLLADKAVENKVVETLRCSVAEELGVNGG
jgi:phosphate acyltransferase